MGNPIKIAILTAAVMGGAAAVGLPAMAADVTVAAGAPGIAFGYSDGYWDQNHQ